jgi:hypothetical protein
MTGKPWGRSEHGAMTRVCVRRAGRARRSTQGEAGLFDN